MFCMCVCVCSVTLDLISSSIVLTVFVITIISVIFIRNFILPGIRYIEISTKHVGLLRYRNNLDSRHMKAYYGLYMQTKAYIGKSNFQYGPG